MSRPRRDLEGEYREREDRKAARAARGERPRSEEATTIAEALEAEREAGRAEGSSRQSPPTPPGDGDEPTSSRPAARTSSTSSSSSPAAPGVTAPMIADVLIISADELVNQHRLPIPSRLLVAFVLFGVLGSLRGDAARPAKVFAWSIVVATFYSAAPGKKPAALAALDAAGGFLSGKYAQPNAGATTSSATFGTPPVVQSEANALVPGVPVT